jgi:hypothetical protein
MKLHAIMLAVVCRQGDHGAPNPTIREVRGFSAIRTAKGEIRFVNFPHDFPDGADAVARKLALSPCGNRALGA